MKATRITKTGSRLYGECVTCGEIKTENSSMHCRPCHVEAEQGKKSGPPADTGGLSIRKLTPEQRVVFEAILRGHRLTSEARTDALGMVNRATKNGTLAEELAYWTEPCGSETHQSSSLAAAIAFGMREGAGA